MRRRHHRFGDLVVQADAAATGPQSYEIRFLRQPVGLPAVLVRGGRVEVVHAAIADVQTRDVPVPLRCAKLEFEVLAVLIANGGSRSRPAGFGRAAASRRAGGSPGGERTPSLSDTVIPAQPRGRVDRSRAGFGGGGTASRSSGSPAGRQDAAAPRARPHADAAGSGTDAVAPRGGGRRGAAGSARDPRSNDRRRWSGLRRSAARRGTARGGDRRRVPQPSTGRPIGADPVAPPPSKTSRSS